MLNAADFPLAANLGLFAAAAALVWYAGTHLARYADVIADRTGAGAAFIGALLLGGVTSLPELATTVTASLIGSAPLAVTNIFGGVAMQVAILVIADLFAGRRALSSIPAQPDLLLQGALLATILGAAAVIVLVGDYEVLGVGVGSTGILLAVLFAFRLIEGYSERRRWVPTERKPLPEQEEPTKRSAEHLSNGQLITYTVLAAVAILIGGVVLAETGDALATQTGLGQSFVGVTLVAMATSLPEVGTTIAAVRLGEYAMGFSNVYGANVLNLSLLFVADVAYDGPPVLSEVGTLAAVGALVGIMVTGIYLGGLVERRDRKLLRLGIDSWLVVFVYLGGLALMYRLR